MILSALRPLGRCWLPFAKRIGVVACLCGLFRAGAFAASAAGAEAAVYVDAGGVLRWRADDRELALFGANYCLPSASDYRAAGYLGADRHRLVEQDFAHFARMGWDGVRLCLWGDWENSDRAGNLVANEHLDLLDYAVLHARRRGIHILLTPITTYSALWPDGEDSDAVTGFSKFYARERLGTDPAAIAAQVNYLRQILEHVNPYTGVALKDEPAIVLIEPINEPVHHSEDLAGSIAYIDALVEAVRATGCRKVVFHNVSQDLRIIPAVKASRMEGVTFGWYPTGLLAGRTLDENYLRTVDAYPALLRPELRHVPKIVYEFDSADVNAAPLYPAMVRAFREGGVQFAAMFAYDMLATAPYNLGWQTHFLNLVASPRKAASAIIAAEAMRRLPRSAHFGDYPQNTRFGEFRVSYEEDLAEMVTPEEFLHAGPTTTVPPDAARLRRLVGLGTSPVVDYAGRGLYFLDRIGEGLWRLEVQPDAVEVQDPFAQAQNHTSLSVRVIAREWPMTLRLPDLGEEFAVFAIDAGNARRARAVEGRFTVAPGVYVLSRSGDPQRERWPERIGFVGFAEFVTLQQPPQPPEAVLALAPAYPANRDARVTAEIIDPAEPSDVQLHVRSAAGGPERVYSLVRDDGYRHTAVLPAGALPPGPFEAFLTANTSAGARRFPAGEGAWSSRVVQPDAELGLFDAAAGGARLAFTRTGGGPRGSVFQVRPAGAGEPAALRLAFPGAEPPAFEDYTASVSVKAAVQARRGAGPPPRVVRLRARGQGELRSLVVTLVEADGTAWTHPLPLTPDWREHVLPLHAFRVGLGVKLPQGYPERWNYWLPPAAGRGHAADAPRAEAFEHLQFSFRPADAAHAPVAGDAFAEIASAALLFTEPPAVSSP